MDAPTERHDTSAQAERRRLVAYVVADDRLFATRTLPLARAAIGMGLSAVVITRVGEHRAAIEAAGVRVVPMESGSGLNPMRAGYAAGQLAGILKALKADIVHCIGLGSIVTGGTAAAMAGVGKRVYEPIGIYALGGVTGRATRVGLKALIRGPLSSRDTRYLFETAADARALGLDPADVAVAIVGEIETVAKPETTGCESETAAMAGAIYAELCG